LPWSSSIHPSTAQLQCIGNLPTAKQRKGPKLCVKFQLTSTLGQPHETQKQNNKSPWFACCPSQFSIFPLDAWFLDFSNCSKKNTNVTDQKTNKKEHFLSFKQFVQWVKKTTENNNTNNTNKEIWHFFDFFRFHFSKITARFVITGPQNNLIDCNQVKPNRSETEMGLRVLIFAPTYERWSSLR
jgi:hypothetical protein